MFCVISEKQELTLIKKKKKYNTLLKLINIQNHQINLLRPKMKTKL